MDLKIGIVGCAGTGKSTLGNALEKRLGVPFLAARRITQPILDRDGYDYCSGVQVERFLADVSRQREIVDRTVEQHQEHSAFITDRTFVDLAAYAVCELHDSDVKLLRNILEECHKQVSTYTHLFICEWRDGAVPDNHRRTLNPWYQFQIYALELGLIEEWGLSHHHLTGIKVDNRVDEIVSALGL